MMLLAPDVPASQRSAATSASSPVADAAAQPSSKPSTPASAAATGPAAKGHQETIEEIVARVQRRLALETPRAPRRQAAAVPQSQPQPTERVTLVWRPAVVWPAELVGPGVVPAPPADPTHASVNRESRP
jgi:hypothetical protein